MTTIRLADHDYLSQPTDSPAGMGSAGLRMQHKT